MMTTELKTGPRGPSLARLVIIGGGLFVAVLAFGLYGQTASSALRANLLQALQSAPIPLVGRYYPDCAAAHAAGAYSIRRGEPGYRSALDPDNDGLACERYKAD